MLKVLIVEDDAAVAALVRALLESEGFLSASSTNLAGAWQLLSAETPDAAVVDLSLAGGDSGWDLIEQVRASETLTDLPIVVLTGAQASDVAERARDLRCVYLGKPFSSAALMDRLQIAIRRVGRGAGTQAWQVSLIVGSYRVEGSVHASGDLLRFSDAWESLLRDQRASIPIAGARVASLDDGRVVASSDLLTVRKDAISMAAPSDALTWGGEPV